MMTSMSWKRLVAMQHRRTIRLATLAVLAAVALAPPSTASATDEGSVVGCVADGLACQQTCLETTDNTAGFTVRECLHRGLATGRAGSPTLAVPDGMLREIGAQLLWRPLLLPHLNRPGKLYGTFTRHAGLEADGLRTMGSHPFIVQVEEYDDSIAFRIDLENHEILSVEGEVLADGQGSLVFTDSASGQERIVLFERGKIAKASDPVLTSKATSSFYMGCYIDTPAYDQFRPNGCYQWGTQASTAVFKVFLPYTPESVVWVLPSHSCSSLFCSAPISPGQSVGGYAYWVINNTPTGPVGATANYQPFW